MYHCCYSCCFYCNVMSDRTQTFLNRIFDIFITFSMTLLMTNVISALRYVSATNYGCFGIFCEVSSLKLNSPVPVLLTLPSVRPRPDRLSCPLFLAAFSNPDGTGQSSFSCLNPALESTCAPLLKRDMNASLCV